jgi:hypothetical protein
MTCVELTANAAGLVSLPSGDEERQAAYTHAQSCRDCARALAEGEELLAFVDSVPAPPPPSHAVLARVAAEIRADLEGRRALEGCRVAATPLATPPARVPWSRRRAMVTTTLLVLVAWAALVASFYHHRPFDLGCWMRSLALAGLAAAGAALSTQLRSAWLPTALVTVSIVFALVRMDLSGTGTIECTRVELAAALLTLVPAAFLMATGRVRGGAATLAGMSAAGALAGHAALDILCRAREWFPHVIVFHTGGVAVAALLGLVVAQVPRLLPARLRSAFGASR